MFNMFASAGPDDRLGCSLPASSQQPITRQLFCFSSCRRDVLTALLQTQDHSRESIPDPHHTSQRYYCTAPGDNHRFGSEVLARHHEYHRACELFRRETERAIANRSIVRIGVKKRGRRAIGAASPSSGCRYIRDNQARKVYSSQPHLNHCRAPVCVY